MFSFHYILLTANIFEGGPTQPHVKKPGVATDTNL